MLAAVILVKAVLAGFVVAMPVGAIGALCMQRALQGRWGTGLVTGGGAAVADGLLAAAALLGLSLLTGYLEEYGLAVRILGGLFLLYFGLRMLRQKQVPSASGAPAEDTYFQQLRRAGDLVAAFFAGFGLTIINPATLLAFVGVFAGLGLFHGLPDQALFRGLVVAGVVFGSFLWWVILTGGSAAVRHHLPERLIVWINRVLGGALIFFAVLAFAGVV